MVFCDTYGAVYMQRPSYMCVPLCVQNTYGQGLQQRLPRGRSLSDRNREQEGN